MIVPEGVELPDETMLQFGLIKSGDKENRV